MSEGFGNDEVELPDEVNASPTADDGVEDGARAKEMASASTRTDMPLATTRSHCYSCEVLKDVIDVCHQEDIPTVNLASPEATVII